MAKITIDWRRCKGCLLCVNVCPKKLIFADEKLNKKGIQPVKFKDNDGACIGCAMCAVICPDASIEVFK